MDSESVKVISAILIPNLGGILNGRQVTKANLDSWYHKLKFPKYRPPNWVFAPVWTAIYTGMGYASYLVYRDGGGFTGEAKLPLGLYCAQLGLNFAWSQIFFKQHNIKGGLIDIIALTITASACGYSFYRINPIAGFIFIPYVGWLCFASLLNYGIFKLNRSDRGKDN